MSDHEEGGGFFSAMESFPEHVHTIGMISIELANLELEMSRLLCHLLGTGKKQAHIIYFTPQSSRARIEIVWNIAKTVHKHDKTRLPLIEKIVDKSNSIIGRRNLALHSAWSTSEEGVFRATLPMISPDVARPIDIQELKDLLGDIRNATSRLIKINDSYEQESQEPPS